MRRSSRDHPKATLLCFDTETTDLPRNWNFSSCRLIQFGWVSYDAGANRLTSQSLYLKPIDGVTCAKEAEAKHGITDDIVEDKGVPRVTALERIAKVLNDAHAAGCFIAAHNVDFHVQTILNEMVEHNFAEKIVAELREALSSPRVIDTMAEKVLIKLRDSVHSEFQNLESFSFGRLAGKLRWLTRHDMHARLCLPDGQQKAYKPQLEAQRDARLVGEMVIAMEKWQCKLCCDAEIFEFERPAKRVKTARVCSGSRYVETQSTCAPESQDNTQG
ncbi:unnamed protein product [Vitrella brassicaformis CCMP3155]|uniref:Exonuclease domain-containing protein n=2 Tax=Vitrella brassicaformis TaxID=1169539 RepID=A0A0G4EHL6_VITBC|nr:unnamed protein product [Vitrella brassicaformis CCMP3155]|eukprot:CEL95473.1 unnamed protein product [Vitrella brassicaformis CCMP3155]